MDLTEERVRRSGQVGWNRVYYVPYIAEAVQGIFYVQRKYAAEAVHSMKI